MKSETQDIALLEEAKNYLNNLSSQKLVAIDFLAYLQQKEEATEELLGIPNFEQELQKAEAEAGEVVFWKDIHRNV